VKSVNLIGTRYILLNSRANYFIPIVLTVHWTCHGTHLYFILSRIASPDAHVCGTVELQKPSVNPVLSITETSVTLTNCTTLVLELRKELASRVAAVPTILPNPGVGFHWWAAIFNGRVTNSGCVTDPGVLMPVPPKTNSAQAKQRSCRTANQPLISPVDPGFHVPAAVLKVGVYSLGSDQN
jgi:hypothetical protein